MNDTVKLKIEDYFRGKPRRAYAKGEIITHAHQEPSGVAYLEKGTVEQYDITAAGNPITVNIFKPPAFFPMSWAINKTPNGYFFAALTDVVLRYAEPNDTVAFLKDNPDVTFDLLSRVYRGTDALLRRLTVASIGIATSRLVVELLIEGYRFGETLHDGKVRIKVQHSSLASRSGLARERVSRELRKLETDGIVSLARGHIVMNIERLESTLDFRI